MYGLTAAHKTLPLNTIVRVTNLDNGKSQILRINDRGPYVGDRILDCSLGAAKKLNFYIQGTAMVKIEIIEIGELYRPWRSVAARMMWYYSNIIRHSRRGD